jgi:hypothetical protein
MVSHATVSNIVRRDSHKSRSRRIVSFLGSSKFFWIIVGLFAAQSVWIALSARYPQAFDEQFHFGIINIYSYHLSPFLNSQPPGADQFGAITRDPSYVYHYLMSFPLRLVRLFTDSLTTQIISLRLINVALLGSSLFVFRKLFRLVKSSEALTNSILFCFVLTPVVPLLASQINYDNLMVPLTALAVYWTAKFSLQTRDTKQWHWRTLARIVGLCLVASLVKYAFLPVFFALVIWLLVDWRRVRRLDPRAPRITLPTSGRQYLVLAGYALFIVIAGSLFVQRYGVNLVRYHTPIPECNQVLSVQACQAYGPWARNYQFAQQTVHLPVDQIATYPFVWLYHSMGELIFTISSNFNDSGTIDYHVGTQLIIIEVLAWSVLGLGTAAVAYYARRLWQDRTLRLFGLVIFVYVAALGGQNYLDYIHLGYPVAIHGRYLLPILPLVYLIVARAFRYALQDIPLHRVSIATRKLSATGLVTALLLFEGGGFVTYIVRSDPSWFWPQSSKAQTVNFKARTILKPLVLDIKPKQ